jgi:glycosyltransferase involved in cell wall biosynthesis/SAM-dependent methyltransferase
LRILLAVHCFLPKYSSGTEILTRDTGLEMLRRGHEVHVLTVDPAAHGKSVDVRHEDYDYRGLKVHALALPRWRSVLDMLKSEYDNELVAEHVRRYVGLLKPDAVHAFHLSHLSGSVIEAFRELGVPVVFTPTDFWSICVMSTLRKPSGELSTGPDEISSNCLECRGVETFLAEAERPEAADKQEFYREIAESALARLEGEHPNMALVRTVLARTEFLRKRFNAVDAILAPTEFMRRTLAANGIDPALITVSPYGIDTSDFRCAGRPNPDSGGLRIGYMGTIHPQKGLDVLLRAFKKLPRNRGVTLRICGELKWYPDYACEVYDLADQDPRINFAGSFPNEQMTDELNKIDVLVVPSTWYENAPLVIYSAFAAGIPVVASNLGGMAEAVRHEENSLLFEPGDPEDLARQLGRLIEEPGLLEKLGKNAGDARSVEDSVDEMLGLYERLRKEKAQERERARKASRSTEEWLWLNYEGIKENPSLREFVAPFPPAELMYAVSGLTDELDFAAHGVHIYKALLRASPVPWKDLPITLDFGCGCGRVARLFKDHEVELHGVDIDGRHIEWIRSNLPYMKAVAKEPNDPLPYPDNAFDAIYSVSVLSHVDEEYHNVLLSELARVSKPGALLFLTVHGERAFERTVNEKDIMDMLNVDELLFQRAAEKFKKDERAFILQRETPLATDEYRYGITFIPASYIRRHWDTWFEVIEIRDGAIHDFQDVVVLRTK